MWFLSARKTRRTSSSCAQRASFRPRLEALEDRCLMSAGALDLTFGTGGLVSGPLPTTIYSNHPCVVVQADGKIVAGAYVVGANGYQNFALARYNTNGSLDTTFGPNHNGVVSTIVGVRDSTVVGLAIDASGNIVAVGPATTLTHVKKGNQNLYYGAFAVARYTTTGALDTNFGNGGIVLTNMSAIQDYSVGANAVTIQTDGKIDVAGTAEQGTTSTSYLFGLVRYTTTGSLDTTFGSGGIVVTPNFGSGADYPRAMALQSNGKIVLAGQVNSSLVSIAAARYTTTGQLDTTFNGSGIVTLPGISGYTQVANGVVVQNSGGIVLAGETALISTSVGATTLVRLTTAGTLDTSFGGAGTGFYIDSNVASTNAFAIAQHPNGDLLTCGRITLDRTNAATNNMLVQAFLPGGTLDTTFGTGGSVTIDFSSSDDRGRAIAVQPDGKIVALCASAPAGTSNYTIALARLQPPATKIGSFTGSSASGSVTLSVSGILNANPLSTISQVNFYLENPDNSLTPLGTGTNNSGTWTFSFAESTFALIAGNSYTFVAQAVDSNGIFSDPAATSLPVT